MVKYADSVERRPMPASEPERGSQRHEILFTDSDGKRYRLTGAPSNPKKIALDLRARRLSKKLAALAGSNPKPAEMLRRLRAKRERLDALSGKPQ